MTILGIETSSAVCSVGLADESNLFVERSIIESHIHSEKLLTLVQDLCDSQKISLSCIDGVAISIGPGSFTGLRIGLSTAKGLCYALEKPLIAVPSFTVVAGGALLAHSECQQVAVCIDAKQGEYYIGLYEKTDDKLLELLPVKVGTLTSLYSAVSGNVIFVTDRVDDVKMALNIPESVEAVLPYYRGDFVAREGIKKFKLGEKNDLNNLEPMYLKDFVVRKLMNMQK